MHFFRTDSEFEADAESSSPCPLILMTGEYDYSCTPEDGRRTAAAIPGAEAIEMKGMGHFPMSENPAAFQEYILPVLNRFSK